MKFFFVAIASLIASMGLISCKKDNVPKPVCRIIKLVVYLFRSLCCHDLQVVDRCSCGQALAEIIYCLASFNLIRKEILKGMVVYLAKASPLFCNPRPEGRGNYYRENYYFTFGC